VNGVKFLLNWDNHRKEYEPFIFKHKSEIILKYERKTAIVIKTNNYHTMDNYKRLCGHRNSDT
jgi:hypothetical protein